MTTTTTPARTKKSPLSPAQRQADQMKKINITTIAGFVFMGLVSLTFFAVHFYHAPEFWLASAGFWISVGFLASSCTLAWAGYKFRYIDIDFTE